ncbi:uncharacterized protein FYW49_015951 [Xenentodon cancila]
MRGTPSKYQNFISRSDLSQPGPPAVYQLEPEVQKFETLTRKTIGEKNVKKMNKTILLVGETGAGKSTLINALVNYVIGVKFEDEVWFQIVDDEKRSQTERQTTDVIVYEMFESEDETLPFSLTIIDTPGFGSTRGIEADVFISQRLLDLFQSEDGVHEIHCLGLVMKASENHLTNRLMFIFNSVTSLFGKNMENSVVTLITHSDGVTPTDVLHVLETAKIKTAKNEENQPVHFLFENCQHENQTKNKRVQKFAFETSQEGMREFMAFLETREPQKLHKIINVLNERVRLTSCIQNLRDRIELSELKQEEIRQTKEGLKKHEEEMNRNKNFTIEVEEVYKDKEHIDCGKWFFDLYYNGAVCCTKCEENCHHPGCTMATSPGSCEVMKGGHCTICSGKCPVSSHVKEGWIYVNKTRKVQKTLQDVKDNYEKMKSEKCDKLNLLENLEEQMKELSSEMWRLVDEAYQHVFRLEEIALNTDSVSTYVHLDVLIKKMKEKGDTEKVKKLEDINKRMDSKVRLAVQYVFGKLKHLK